MILCNGYFYVVSKISHFHVKEPHNSFAWPHMHQWEEIRMRTVHTQEMRTIITVALFGVYLFGGSEALIYCHDFRGVTIDGVGIGYWIY
jgi:hypothetical protein